MAVGNPGASGLAAVARHTTTGIRVEKARTAARKSPKIEPGSDAKKPGGCFGWAMSICCLRESKGPRAPG